jgi:hypothetical protein
MQDLSYFLDMCVPVPYNPKSNLDIEIHYVNEQFCIYYLTMLQSVRILFLSFSLENCEYLYRTVTAFYKFFLYNVILNGLRYRVCESTDRYLHTVKNQLLIV